MTDWTIRPYALQNDSLSSSLGRRKFDRIQLPRRAGQAQPIRTCSIPAIAQNSTTTTTTTTTSTAENSQRIQNRNTQRPSRSASPTAQILVRLENPRPQILRTANEYIRVERQRLDESKTQSSPTTTTTTTTTTNIITSPARIDFDRAKIHNCRMAKKTTTNSLGLGEIKPLVKSSQDSARKVHSQSGKLTNSYGGTIEGRKSTEKRRGHFNEGATDLHHDLRTLVGEASSSQKRPLSSPASLNHSAVASTSTSSRNNGSEQQPKLICSHCGKCRCAQCKRPRQLPSRWFCSRSCLVSADCLVDCLSCMCIVRGCCYHCSSTSPDTQFGTNNCSPRAWGCLAAASLVLPCLCCYPPLKLCSAMIQRLYAWANDSSCHCNGTHPHLTGGHRLWDDSGQSRVAICKQPAKSNQQWAPTNSSSLNNK